MSGLTISLRTPVHVAPATLHAYLRRAGMRLVPGWELPGRVQHGGGARRYRLKVGVRAGEWFETIKIGDAAEANKTAGSIVLEAAPCGPFTSWRLAWRVTPEGAHSRLEGELHVGGNISSNVAAELRRWLDWIAERVRMDSERIAAWDDRLPKRVAIGGASGLIGTALRDLLVAAGCEVAPLIRAASARDRTGDPAGIPWRPGGDIDVLAEALEGVDAVVHLGGEPIAGARWTPRRKREIRDSRVDSTRTLAEAIVRMRRRPQVFLCASAIGFYGNREDAVLTEESPPGQGFLPDVCREWESSADAARSAGVRTVHARIGIVLSSQGGALAELARIFRLGLGGRAGSGRQYMSWITLEDATAAFGHLLSRDDLSGPVNLTAPRPEMNYRFSRALGDALGRPVILPAPAFAIRLLFGEMGQRLVLEGSRVRPQVLERSGFEFSFSELMEALRWELGRRYRTLSPFAAQDTAQR